MTNESTATEGEQCPIVGCERILSDGEDGHWHATGHGYHEYHTDKEGIARTWEHRDGLDVTPGTDPFEKVTRGETSTEL